MDPELFKVNSLIVIYIASFMQAYLSNRPHFLRVYRGNNPRGMFGRTRESL